MIVTIITILIAVGIVFFIWYLLKNVTTLIINSIVVIITLIVVSQFGILGMETFKVTWASVIICAIGGLPGAILLILFNAVGIAV